MCMGGEEGFHFAALVTKFIYSRKSDFSDCDSYS